MADIFLKRARFAWKEETGVCTNSTLILITLALMLEKKAVHGTADSRMPVLVEDTSGHLVRRGVRENCVEAVFSVRGHLVYFDQWVSIWLDTGVTREF